MILEKKLLLSCLHGEGLVAVAVAKLIKHEESERSVAVWRVNWETFSKLRHVW